jgi:MFS family permease
MAGAAYALAGATLSPVGGRLADRLGPGPVLVVTAALHPVALVGLLFVATSRAPLGWIIVASALAGATYPPSAAAVRGAWNALTGPTSGRFHLRRIALAAETSLFEIVYVAGPILVAGFVTFATPAAAIVAAAAVTLVGTVAVARGRAMRGIRPHPHHVRTTGLGPLRVPGFAALLVCVSGLGLAFGSVGVAVPAYAAGYSDSLGGILLGIWGVGSALGGVWFGTRRVRTALSRQFAWLLAAVAATLAVFAVMPGPLALGIALVLGGAAIAPALTVENALVGHIVPTGMMNEAYTWVVTVSVAASAAGGAVTGVIVDRPGGVPWAFLLAAGAVAVGALVASPRTGAIGRADAQASTRMEGMVINAA